MFFVWLAEHPPTCLRTLLVSQYRNRPALRIAAALSLRLNRLVGLVPPKNDEFECGAPRLQDLLWVLRFTDLQAFVRLMRSILDSRRRIAHYGPEASLIEENLMITMPHAL